MRRLLSLTLVLTLAGAARSAPRVEADPNKVYPVTPEVGNYLVCAASYTGQDALEMARQVVYELRSKHGLPAYTFNRGENERRKQQEEWEAQKRANPGVHIPRRMVRIPDQVVVLVGGYKTDQEAKAMLDSVKKLPIPKIDLGEGRTTADTIVQYVPKADGSGVEVRRAAVSPYVNAFVSRNPSLGEAPKQKWDPFWKELNAEEEYSLLNNKKPWTVVVKVYTGFQTMQPQNKSSSFLEMLGFGGNKQSELLNAAGHNAHELARVLRKMKFEAWVLHTRDSSIVTIGGFDGLNDPAIDELRKKFEPVRKNYEAMGEKDPIKFFTNPQPMEVPRFN